MSEFLAEARILVRPDTSRFRTDLEAQLKSTLARPVKIPVVPVVSGNVFAASVAGTAAFTAAQQSAAAATGVTAEALATATTIQRQYAGAVELSAVKTNQLAAAQTAEAAAASESAAANAAAARSQAGFARGVGASGLTLFGLRGATLAASGAFLAGTAAVVGFSKAVQSAAQLETELNVFKVTAGATADEMERVSEAAKQLGRDITLPGVTAGDAATAMTELAKAGLSVQDSLNGARGALQLATAAQIDNVTATKLVAGALNSFQLSGNEAVRVADLLTGAANESQGEISDMGTALGQASAVAHLFGVSVEDTVTLLTELAKAGIAGGRAGTSLRVAFLRLVNPPAEAAKALKELNVQIRDSQGNLRPQIFSDITTALEGYTRAQRQARLATIFGSDAVRAAAIIGAQGADGFNQVSDAINEFGLAQRQAAARTSGFAGASENLKNQVSALGLSLGNVAKGPLTVIVKGVSNYVSGANQAIEATTGWIAKLKEMNDIQLDNIPFVNDDFGLRDLQNRLTELAPTLAVMAGQTAQAGKELEDFSQQAADTRTSILNIIAAGKKTGGDLGLNEALVALDALVQELNKGGPVAQKFASEVAKIRGELQKSGTTGFRLFPDDVTTLFPPDLLSGAVSKKVGQTNRDALEESLSGRDLFSFTKASFDNVTQAIVASGKEAETAARSSFAKVVSAAKEQIAKIDESFDIAAAAGDTAGELAALNKQKAAQEKIRAAADAAAQEIGAGNKGFATAVARRREAQRALVGINDQIRAINDKIASDAQRDADKAKSDQEALLRKREQLTRDAIEAANKQAALLEEQARAEENLRNSRLDLAIQAAGLTPGEGDDRKAINKKISVLNAQIKGLDAIKKKTLEQKQKIVDLKSAVLSLRSSLKSLSGSEASGFSLNDLFKEAADQFTTFGSNITGRNGVLSGQDERAAFSKGVLDGVAKQQLTETQRQTLVLERIAANTAPINDVLWKRQTQNLSTNPNAGGYKYSSGFAAKMAADNQYG